MAQTLRYNAGHLAAITNRWEWRIIRARRQCYNQIDPWRHGLQSPARPFAMFCSRHFVGILLVLGLIPGLAWAAPQKTQNAHTVPVKAAAKRSPDPVVQPPTPPAPPPTPEQMPAQPPQVSYLNGQLTIISRNSTLGDILHAVARQTGASIDLPSGAGFERVAGRMGPGPARNVLADLLNGSRYDYVMIASTGNPGGLQHVILTPKTAGADNPSPPPVTAYQPPPQQPDQEAMPNEPEMPPDASVGDQEIPPPSTEEAGPQEPPEEPPQKPDYPRADMSGQQQPDAQQAPGVKTPEQLLQELQRMQQQQQQQQQQNQPQ
jgi:hypothetical protein